MLFGHVNISLTNVRFEKLMIHKCLSVMLLRDVHTSSFKVEADSHFSAITGVCTLHPHGSQGIVPH